MELGYLADYQDRLVVRAAGEVVACDRRGHVLQKQCKQFGFLIHAAVVPAGDVDQQSVSEVIVEVDLVLVELLSDGNLFDCRSGGRKLDDHGRRARFASWGVCDFQTYCHAVRAGGLADGLGCDRSCCCMDAVLSKCGSHPLRGKVFHNAGDRDTCHGSSHSLNA